MNEKFNKKEKLLVVRSMLLQINLPVFRANNLYIQIPKLGTIFTRSDRKKSKAKYQKKYNKRTWAKKREEIDFSEKKLLF